MYAVVAFFVQNGDGVTLRRLVDTLETGHLDGLDFGAAGNVGCGFAEAATATQRAGLRFGAAATAGRRTESEFAIRLAERFHRRVVDLVAAAKFCTFVR